jgi:mannose-1-phosphate guanylyltransferase
LKLDGEHSMLQRTLLRFDSFDSPVLVCNDMHRFLAHDQVEELGLDQARFIIEPAGRNTAPAIALAALTLLDQKKEAVMLIAPSDHEFADDSLFLAAVENAVDHAAQGFIVTFGLTIQRAETGFGYIKTQGVVGGALDVVGFEEKPNESRAHELLADPNVFWNSGIFVVRPDVYLDELKKARPDIYEATVSLHEQATWRGADLDFPKSIFEQCPSESIDYAVMERTKIAKVIPLDTGWVDLGSFNAVWEHSPKDESGNALTGDVLARDTSDSLIRTDGPMVAVVGMSDVSVIATNDVVLVSSRAKSQDVKNIVESLRAQGRTEHLLHREVHRPWGTYDSIDSGDRYQVKRISVKPGASLSLQMHHHRAEHWIVVKGTALVKVDEQEHLLAENQSIYIPLGSTHRLTNPGKVDLQLIEVQTGSYLGEDDIVRFEDKFGRV